MPPMQVILCSYSHGLGNGIAHMDAELLHGFAPSEFSVRLFVLRPDWPAGRREFLRDAVHISLADAFQVLCQELRTADIMQVNGAYDPVACSAAAATGVPGIIEVMHQVEPGGLHEAVDRVVCVSDLVRSVQPCANTMVLYNGIDTERFFFRSGRRHDQLVTVIQVANASKALHYELGEIAAELSEPLLRPLMVGDRKPVHGLESTGPVQDMPAAYHDADLLFLLENRAAFGLVFAEAMACGTLPIVSADSGAVEFVKHGKTGWVVEPGPIENAVQALRQAVETVQSPGFDAMQLAAREVAVNRLGRQAMLDGYAGLWRLLGKRPRKRPKQAPAWMNLALFVQLWRNGNKEASYFLEAFLADPRSLEPSFICHPIGQAAIALLIRDISPELLHLGMAPLVRLLCSRLRRAPCITPALDSLERKAGARNGSG